jgi:hypothetical protein
MFLISLERKENENCRTSKSATVAPSKTEV